MARVVLVGTRRAAPSPAAGGTSPPIPACCCPQRTPTVDRAATFEVGVPLDINPRQTRQWSEDVRRQTRQGVAVQIQLQQVALISEEAREQSLHATRVQAEMGQTSQSPQEVIGQGCSDQTWTLRSNKAAALCGLFVQPEFLEGGQATEGTYRLLEYMVRSEWDGAHVTTN